MTANTYDELVEELIADYAKAYDDHTFVRRDNNEPAPAWVGCLYHLNQVKKGLAADLHSILELEPMTPITVMGWQEMNENRDKVEKLFCAEDRIAWVVKYKGEV